VPKTTGDAGGAGETRGLADLAQRLPDLGSTGAV
jgi:hypothetical protein